MKVAVVCGERAKIHPIDDYCDLVEEVLDDILNAHFKDMPRRSYITELVKPKSEEE